MMFSPSPKALNSCCEHCGSRSLPLQLKTPSRSLTPSTPFSTSTASYHLATALAPSRKTAIVNVRVFDGYKVGEPTTVVIDGDKIVASSNAMGAQMVDGEGGVLIPGLIDSHCHIDTEAKLKTLPTYGVTTALDMAEYPVSIMHDIKALAGKNGYADYRSAGLAATSQSTFPHPQGMIPGVSGAKQWVEDRVHEGSDYIKMLADNPLGELPKEEELAAVATGARELKKLSIAHAVSRQGQQRAQDAKVSFITHAPLDEAIDTAFAQKMVAEDRWAIPTLIMMKLTAEALGGSDQTLGMEKAAVDFSFASKSVKIMHDAGVAILAGDDTNTVAFAPAHPEVGLAMHQELELLVDAGLSPTEALRAATVTPARKFGLWDRGIVMPGRRADLVLLSKDPTKDIANIDTIKQVWTAGVSWKPTPRLLDISGFADYGWGAANPA